MTAPRSGAIVVEPHSGIPDILPQLTAEMERRGYSGDLIDGFRALWMAVPDHAQILPCPVCYAGGWFYGKLELVWMAGSNTAVCLICESKIAL
jgi:hypothetical protein